SWSAQFFVPTYDEVRPYLLKPDEGLLTEHEHHFYCISEHSDTAIRVGLIPISLKDPIQRDYLGDYVFLGRYNGRRWVGRGARRFIFETGANVAFPAVKIERPGGGALFSVIIQDTTPFRAPFRAFA